MLLFIYALVLIEREISVISIHLMLLFISDSVALFDHGISFQYISCYCLSSFLPLPQNSKMPFQYISCYCLSPLCLMLLWFLADFNTSHVTVYRTTCYHLPIYIVKFQYISCYCLSVWNTALLPFCFIFQYISCYCLSSAVMYGSWSVFNFNTSHVTVYRFCFVPAAAVRDNFNTSHVTVYQCWLGCFCCICRISIHLMLLFILTAFACSTQSLSFQYISCYCLSY